MIKIDDILCEGVVYKTTSCKFLRSYYKIWLSSLNKNEKKAFKRYRCRCNIKNNVNEKLRLNKDCPDAKIMSAALKKSNSPHNLVVFRSIDKNENVFMSKLNPGEEYVNYDFKGTHVYDRIPNRYWSSSGYILYLIPQGYPSAYINNVTLYAWWEKELIIDVSSTCKLIEVREINQKPCYIVKVQEK